MNIRKIIKEEVQKALREINKSDVEEAKAMYSTPLKPNEKKKCSNCNMDAVVEWENPVSGKTFYKCEECLEKSAEAAANYLEIEKKHGKPENYYTRNADSF